MEVLAANSVTEVGHRMLAHIKDANDGLTRSQLAERLNRNKLNHWHIAQLKRLSEDGLISIETRQHTTRMLIEYVYHAV